MTKRPKLTQGHYHEFIDRMHIITCNIDTHILQHPVCKLNKDVCAKIEKAMELLYEAYRLGGSKEEIKNPIKKEIGLLNYEGDVLKLQKIGKIDDTYQFRVVDQWNKHIDLFTFQMIEDFLNGSTTIIDSKGKAWNYAEAHTNAKPSKEKIFDFMISNYD